MNFRYKRNGAGDVYRKHKKKVEVFYRGKWIHASVIGTIKENRKAWNCSVLVEIGEEEALKRIQEQQ